ncbi:MAG: hypothetical protein IJQ47_07785, partial [Synergistaceae bacterium]|nr:hypothetical protein [Synergistaceae bacterium]
TSSTKIKDRQCKHTCKVNFSVAVKIIRRYFLDKLELFEVLEKRTHSFFKYALFLINNIFETS